MNSFCNKFLTCSRFTINENREIVLHAEDIDGICRESNNGTSSGGDILVFSCGHVYSKQIFFEEVLEHFKQRLLKLRYTLPATLAVILKEYRKEHISCACPKCLIMYFEDIDQHIDRIRYVNNCRGRGGTDWSKPVYYPKRIEIEF